MASIRHAFEQKRTHRHQRKTANDAPRRIRLRWLLAAVVVGIAVAYWCVPHWTPFPNLM